MKKIIQNFKKKKIKTILKKKGKNQHLLITGDSSVVLKNIPDESIDLIFTDPPYNAGLKYGKTFNDNLPWSKYHERAKKWFSEYNRILKKTGSIYIMNYPEINAKILPYLENDLDLNLQRWITWHYPTNIGHSKKNFTRSQRSILFLTKSKKYTFNRAKILQPFKNENVKKIKEKIKKGIKGRGAYDMLSFLDLVEMKYTSDEMQPFDVHDINLLKNISTDRLKTRVGTNVKSLHPCQLPFELIKRFIEVSSNPGDVVLDPFAGTFSTSAVADQLNRNSIGIEINSKFTKLGYKRMK